MTPQGNPEPRIRQCRAGRGSSWLNEAGTLVAQAPGIWLGLMAILTLCRLFLGLLSVFLPGVAQVGTKILEALFDGGVMVACDRHKQHGKPRVEDLFGGFSGPHAGSLVLVAVLFMLGGLLIILAIGGVGLVLWGPTLLRLVMDIANGTPPQADMSMTTALDMLLLVLLGMLAMIPLMMAYLFAPALVVFNRLPAVAAMRLSFRACMQNMMAFLVYGLWLLLGFIVLIVVGGLFLGIVAAVGQGLAVMVGLVVGMPVVLLLLALVQMSIYTAYRDVFEPVIPEEATPESADEDAHLMV